MQDYYQCDLGDLMDKTLDCLHDSICDGLDVFEQSVKLSIPTLSEDDSNKPCTEAVDRMTTFFDKRLDDSFPGFEEYAIRRVLRLPVAYDSTEDHSDLASKFVNVTEEELDQKISALVGEIRSSSIQNQMITGTLSIRENDLQHFKEVAGHVSGLADLRHDIQSGLWNIIPELKELVDQSKALSDIGEETILSQGESSSVPQSQVDIKLNAAAGPLKDLSHALRNSKAV